MRSATRPRALRRPIRSRVRSRSGTSWDAKVSPLNWRRDARPVPRAEYGCVAGVGPSGVRILTIAGQTRREQRTGAPGLASQSPRRWSPPRGGHLRAALGQEDLTQDIALALWNALPSFHGECSERTFVYRIAHNRGVNHLVRRRARSEPLTDPADESRALKHWPRSTSRCRGSLPPSVHSPFRTDRCSPSRSRTLPTTRSEPVSASRRQTSSWV